MGGREEDGCRGEGAENGWGSTRGGGCMRRITVRCVSRGMRGGWNSVYVFGKQGALQTVYRSKTAVYSTVVPDKLNPVQSNQVFIAVQ